MQAVANERRREHGPQEAVSWAALPLGAPPQAEALRALTGEVSAPAEALEGLKRLRGTFTDIEEDTLAGGALPFDAATFRDALGLRLRLTLALAHLQCAPGTANADALNALLAEVDAVLDRLRASEAGVPPAVLERLHLTRDALVQEAVQLSEVGVPTRAPGEPSPLRRPAPAAAAGAGRLVAYSAEDVRQERRRSRKQKALLAVTLVLVLGGVGLQVQRARTEYTPPPTVAGAPPGVSVREDSRGGLMVRSLEQAPLSEEVQRWASTYEQRGFHRRALGPAAFYLEPPSAAPPTPR